jgi:hypothetical protein
MLSVIKHDCSAHGLTEQADIHRTRWRHLARDSPLGVTPGFHLSPYSVFGLTGSSPCGRLSKSKTCCSRILLFGRRMATPPPVPPGLAYLWFGGRHRPGMVLCLAGATPLGSHKLSVSVGGRPVSVPPPGDGPHSRVVGQALGTDCRSSGTGGDAHSDPARNSNRTLGLNRSRKGAFHLHPSGSSRAVTLFEEAC